MKPQSDELERLKRCVKAASAIAIRRRAIERSISKSARDAVETVHVARSDQGLSAKWTWMLAVESLGPWRRLCHTVDPDHLAEYIGLVIVVSASSWTRVRRDTRLGVTRLGRK